jgi:hydroxyacylglutathione hydrolase
VILANRIPRFMNKKMDVYTGGLFETHCYYLPGPRLLIDAPEGAGEWLRQRGYHVEGLLLTHGHVDHVWDAAKVQREHPCSVFYHAETTPMVRDKNFFRHLGMPWEVDPIEGGIEIEEQADWSGCGMTFRVLYVPGHCPGSLCFLDEKEKTLFGGDVLFRGGVGRWDLPGGDRELLLEGIRSKLMGLGDDVKVLPGHGPATTIGIERVGNPYVLGKF